ncbi:hypothetical protein CUMW_124650 [Citrus unshiu]|nr:hypothetical protein CUMW_124650 [Citrus unshiu]
MSAYGVSFSLLFLLILANVISPNESSKINQANGSLSLESKSEEMVPLMEIKTVMMMNETRRKLNSFQICACSVDSRADIKSCIHIWVWISFSFKPKLVGAHAICT